MIALLVFGIGLPGVVFGFIGGQVWETHLGFIALGMAVAGCVVRDVRAYVTETRRPLP